MNRNNMFHFKPITILFFVISTIILLIYSLGYKDALEPIKYFSYLYSTFSLIVFLFNVKRIYLYLKSCIVDSNIFKSIKKILYNNILIRKYFEDINFKTLINLCFSSIINLSFIFIKFTDGLLNRSIWFVSLSLYYFLLTIVRIILLNNIRKFNKEKEYMIYRNVGYFIMILNVALVIMIIQMVNDNVAVVYEEYIIYLTAFYTFYLIISAIINVFIYKKYNSPILSSVKVINLLTASVSILMLQTTMIATFGDNELEFMRLMNSVTGGVISVITLSISIYMIIKGQKKIKTSKD